MSIRSVLSASTFELLFFVNNMEMVGLVAWFWWIWVPHYSHIYYFIRFRSRKQYNKMYATMRWFCEMDTPRTHKRPKSIYFFGGLKWIVSYATLKMAIKENRTDRMFHVRVKEKSFDLSNQTLLFSANGFVTINHGEIAMWDPDWMEYFCFEIAVKWAELIELVRNGLPRSGFQRLFESNPLIIRFSLQRKSRNLTPDPEEMCGRCFLAILTSCQMHIQNQTHLGIPTTNQGIIRKYPEATKPIPKAHQYPGCHIVILKLYFLPSFSSTSFSNSILANAYARRIGNEFVFMLLISGCPALGPFSPIE